MSETYCRVKTVKVYKVGVSLTTTAGNQYSYETAAGLNTASPTYPTSVIMHSGSNADIDIINSANSNFATTMIPKYVDITMMVYTTDDKYAFDTGALIKLVFQCATSSTTVNVPSIPSSYDLMQYKALNPTLSSEEAQYAMLYP
jgi:hypothetical protein